MNPEYGEVVAAFGSTYLGGKISQVMQANKFCMVDNLDGTEAGESSVLSDEENLERRRRVRYPLRISMSFSIYCKSGTISARIQQKEYNLSEGDMLLIFAGQILESASLGAGSKVIFIAIDSEFILTQIRNRYGNILRDWVLRSKEPTLIHLDAANAIHFEELCRSIKFIIQDAGDDYSDGIIYGFTTIFANLLTSWYKRTSSLRDGDVVLDGPMTNAQKVLLRFQGDIHHFSDRYKRVSYYAKRQNLSTRRFSQLINEASGRKPSDLITEYLILEAKSLLCTGIYSVHQVCEKLGFDNDSFFNRWFKKATGTTPGRYV